MKIDILGHIIVTPLQLPGQLCETLVREDGAVEQIMRKVGKKWCKYSKKKQLMFLAIADLIGKSLKVNF